jgi:hypothetical protein
MSVLVALPLLWVPAQETAAPATPAEEFRRIGEALYAGDNPFIGRGDRERLEQQLADPALPTGKRIEGLIKLGREYLKNEDARRALDEFEAARELAGERPEPALALRLHRQLGIAWLRLAEQENCNRRHNPECCLFPLEGGALHTERTPAAKALEHLLAVLALVPGDPDALWLLNIAAMALGEYPDGVPERWRLPAKAFASEAEFPRFRDVAARAGTDVLAMAGGVAVEDYDGDGWLDILTSTCDPLGPLVYLHNDGDGTFSDRSAAAGVQGQLGGLNLLTGDPDNDGDWDVLVLRGAWMLDHGQVRRSLLTNEKGRFTDVTHAAGLAEPAHPGQAALFGDFDGDGWLDVYAGHESLAEAEGSRYPSQLFRNRGDGSFANDTKRAGVANDRYAKGVAAGDHDNDGDLDLFVANIGLDRLYRNAGDGTFEDVATRAGVTGIQGRHFACWFFDADNDGWLDLWVGGYDAELEDMVAAAFGRPDDAMRPRLLMNRRDGTFHDIAAEAGIARPLLPMGANFGDLDNDGWLDIYLGTGDPSLPMLVPNVLLWNRGGKRFLDVTRAAGMGHLQKGHGIAFADLDRDGDQDVVHQLGGFFRADRFHSALFENPGSENRWLVLRLVGTHTNRAAFGARVRLVLETPEGERELHRAVGSVSSFGGSPHVLEIGLGDATRIVRLEILWPRSEEPQVFADVPLDAALRIVEGADELERRAYSSSSF